MRLTSTSRTTSKSRTTGLIGPRWRDVGYGHEVDDDVLNMHEHQVDTLLSEGLHPCLTLFSNELPPEIEAFGGWRNRQTVDQFIDYVGAVASRLGDRVESFITFESPMRYLDETFRAGGETLIDAASAGMLDAAHHILVAHGEAARIIRAHSPLGRIGIELEPSPVRADPSATDSLESGWANHWFPHALAYGTYPEAVVEEFGWDQATVLHGDEFKLARAIDFIAISAENRPGSMIDSLALDYGFSQFSVLSS